jgi:hypothetical protein
MGKSHFSNPFVQRNSMGVDCRSNTVWFNILNSDLGTWSRDYPQWRPYCVRWFAPSASVQAIGIAPTQTLIRCDIRDRMSVSSDAMRLITQCTLQALWPRGKSVRLFKSSDAPAWLYIPCAPRASLIYMYMYMYIVLIFYLRGYFWFINQIKVDVLYVCSIQSMYKGWSIDYILT